MDEKHKEYLVIGGAIASVAGLYFLLRKGSPASSPAYGQMGSSGGGGGGNPNQDTANRLQAASLLTNYQLSSQKMAQDLQIAQMQANTQLAINQNNLSAQGKQSLMSAASKAAQQALGMIPGGGTRTPQVGANDPNMLYSRNGSFGNVFSDPNKYSGVDLGQGAPYGSEEGAPYYGAPYLYDGTSTPGSRFDDQAALSYAPFDVPTGPEMGPAPAPIDYQNFDFTSYGDGG